MADINYLLLVILFMTAATYTTRLTPFVLFANHKETPMLTFIAKSTPPMVMTILLIYMLRGINYLSFWGGISIFLFEARFLTRNHYLFRG